MSDGRYIGRLDHNGKQIVGSMMDSAEGDAVAALLGAERLANETLKKSQDLLQEAEVVSERVQALHGVIGEKVETERETIVAVILSYANDCAERAAQIEEATTREHQRLSKTGHHQEAETLSKMQQARIAAFNVRAAIAADIAHKVEMGWGRNPDGSPMAKVDADSEDVVSSAARLKSV